jgi:putative FmdB family regulatory protein
VPIYSYRCTVCEVDLDRITSISVRDEQNCSDCNSKLIRGIDLPGMVWSPTRNGGHSF